MSKKPENLNTIRQSCGSSLLYSAAKNKHAKESLVWNPMSEDWKENCRDEFWF